MDVEANVTRMFEAFEPWDCSNSVANYGPDAARMTWLNALTIASRHEDWLASDLTETCEAMRDWARDAGAWERAEITAWDEDHCLALFVQNIASDLRNHLDVDNQSLPGCVRLYVEAVDANHDGIKRLECQGHYDMDEYGNVLVWFYTGI